jgi:hypothetical protein
MASKRWVEAYACGCVSKPVPRRELLGYCPKHGSDVSMRHAEANGVAVEYERVRAKKPRAR